MPNIWTTSVALSRGLICSLWILCAALAGALTAQEAEPTYSPEQLEFFENRIRPVLVEHCYKCHSAEAAKAGDLEGGLTLDTRAGLLSGGDSGPAIVPGKPAESLLLEALHYETYEMPPAGKLPDAVIADFAKWIESGAADPRQGTLATPARKLDIEAGKQFWSFQPLSETAPPDLGGELDQLAPIDRFIRQKLLAKKIEPTPLAPPRILIRRVWFDLLGVPPTPEEAQTWTTRLTKDLAPGQTLNRDAWGELVQALLARPEYGERWARHWMDVARFGESHGYEQDYDRPTAYHYRDFLIKAFNADLPYDKFVQWQIAGDELQPNEPLAWMATGFLGGGAFPTQLTETEFESARYDELDDMTATSGVAFLGLSLGCARCHDHKFDPIGVDDYYRFAAAFTTAIRSEKEFDLDPVGNQERRTAYEKQLREAREAIAAYERTELPQELRKWLAEQSAQTARPATWQVLAGELSSSGGTRFVTQGDGSYLATDQAPSQEVLRLTAAAEAGTVRSFRLEALADPSLPRSGPGRADNGNFALGNVEVERVAQNGDTKSLKLLNPRATHQQNGDVLSIAASIDSDQVSGWAVDGQIGKSQAAVFDLAEPLELQAGDRLRVTLTFNHPNARHAIGRPRFSWSEQSELIAEVGEAGPPSEVVAAIKRIAPAAADQQLELAQLTPNADWSVVLAWYRPQAARYQQLAAAVSEIERKGSGAKMTRVLVTAEGLPHLPHHADDRGFPHFYPETHLLRRGDVAQKVEVVSAGYPRVLQRGPAAETDLQIAPPEDRNPATSYRRAALAQWLTNLDSGAGPLVARVMVNRLWHHHFGRGIVATPNDFGTVGERPTHPELLDWLAGELVRGGWRLKPIHQAICTSETYLQGNRQPDDPRLSIDLDNQLVWYRAPRRLEAEAIRDAMLTASGQLDRTMYGPGTLDQNMRRRSVYFFIKRSGLIPMMMLFDWPEHLVSIGQRQTTTVAPQALMFMNSPQGRQYAEALARQIAGASDDTTAICRAYLLALSREPNADELRVAQEFIESARKLRREEGEAQVDTAALADFCQLLFGLNEFIYID
ncbi:MAG: PSD1 and planctomycete cytochrome C domain-containing protein [Planctomycetota bacterium]